MTLVFVLVILSVTESVSSRGFAPARSTDRTRTVARTRPVARTPGIFLTLRGPCTVPALSAKCAQ